MSVNLNTFVQSFAFDQDLQPKIDNDKPAAVKGRESGMPEEKSWKTFFNAEGVVRTFFDIQGSNTIGDVLDIGCGYGTFTLPAANLATGTVYGLDVDEEVITKAKQYGLGTRNVQFINQSEKLKTETISHVMTYNLLHIEEDLRKSILTEAFRVLKSDGKLSVINWKREDTPRGPPMNIRPTEEQTMQWIKEAGFEKAEMVDIADHAKFHYGIIASKSKQ